MLLLLLNKAEKPVCTFLDLDAMYYLVWIFFLIIWIGTKGVNQLSKKTEENLKEVLANKWA